MDDSDDDRKVSMMRVPQRIRPLVAAGFWCALVATVAACGGDASTKILPTGDPLDDLLNSVTNSTFEFDATLKCLTEVGAGVAEWRALQVKGNEVEPSVTVAVVGSGLVAQALEEARPSATQAKPPDAVSTTLRDALTMPVLVGGTEYKGGCFEYSAAMAAAQPAEILRLDLNRRYVETVGQRVFADPRWSEADNEWSRCMDEGGYGNLRKPGDEISLILRRIELAAGDIDKLKETLTFDVQISTVSERCSSGNIANKRSEVRAEYEQRFLDDNRPDLERLVLLKAEQTTSG